MPYMDHNISSILIPTLRVYLGSTEADIIKETVSTRSTLRMFTHQNTEKSHLRLIYSQSFIAKIS